MANRARIPAPRHDAGSRVPRYLQVASASDGVGDLRRRDHLSGDYVKLDIGLFP
jgi:hypothetical protein